MRTTIIGIVILGFIAIAQCEMCSQSSDCSSLACSGMEVCEHGYCTCDNQPKCTTRDDCVNMAHMHGHCVASNLHCIDGHCRCTHTL